ncbi:acyltransferase family protein [Pedobacter arcticus]|uniref:acyltransferase family protein n=1 Tax=Pedobacter arcticus TaxID=752140 RepID=UPI00030DFC3B|nr:acyltransferase [Pedobacter arcticus]
MLNRQNKFLFPKISITYEGAKHHILALDGLRGIAILLVLLFHTFHFMLGWCGVDLFFVLSGFLITGILIETKNHPFYFQNFWIKRVLRIFPLYYFVLAIIIIPKVFFRVNTVTHTSWTYWFYLQNWEYTIKGVFPDGKDTMNHFWSLAIEEQFYFFFPFVVKYIKDSRTPWVLLAFIIIAIGFRFYYFSDGNIGYYVGTFSRMDSLAIGAIIAYFIRYNRFLLEKWTLTFFYISLTYIVAVLIFTKSLHFSNPYFASLGLTFFALLFGSVLILSISELKSKFLVRVLTLKALLFIGKISYGLYVFHWVLYVFIKPPLEAIIYSNLPYSIFSKVITSLIIGMMSLVLAYFSFHYFEKRFLNLKKKWVR